MGLLTMWLQSAPGMALRVVFIQQDAPDVASLRREVDRLKLLVEANPIGDLMALMELFLAFLGFVLVIAGLVGFNEWNRVRKLSKQAEGILKQAEAQVAKAAIASDKVHEMKEGLAGAWGHIDEHLSALTLDEQDLVVGISPSLLEPMSRSRFEDADILLVVSDRYNLLMDAERASGHFRALARFWRRVGNHPRSLERLERASVLWPQSDKILIDLAMGQALWVHVDPHGDRRARLDLALKTAMRAHGLKATWQSHHAQAWILDSLDRWNEAICEYREARRLCHLEKSPSTERAFRNITYNLACSFAKAKKTDEALEALRQVIDHDDNRVAASRDEDLASLRHDSRFREMVEGSGPAGTPS